MTTEAKPIRYLPLPAGDGKIVIQQGESGEIRWLGRDAFPWLLKYSYGSDGSYSLEMRCEYSFLFGGMDLDAMLTTVQRLIESGRCDGQMPLDFRVEASLRIQGV